MGGRPWAARGRPTAWAPSSPCRAAGRCAAPPRARTACQTDGTYRRKAANSFERQLGCRAAVSEEAFLAQRAEDTVSRPLPPSRAVEHRPHPPLQYCDLLCSACRPPPLRLLRAQGHLSHNFVTRVVEICGDQDHGPDAIVGGMQTALPLYVYMMPSFVTRRQQASAGREGGAAGSFFAACQDLAPPAASAALRHTAGKEPDAACASQCRWYRLPDGVGNAATDSLRARAASSEATTDAAAPGQEDVVATTRGAPPLDNQLHTVWSGGPCRLHLPLGDIPHARRHSACNALESRGWNVAATARRGAG
jgi:hypothetical protein